MYKRTFKMYWINNILTSNTKNKTTEHMLATGLLNY